MVLIVILLVVLGIRMLRERPTAVKDNAIFLESGSGGSMSAGYEGDDRNNSPGPVLHQTQSRDEAGYKSGGSNEKPVVLSRPAGVEGHAGDDRQGQTSSSGRRGESRNVNAEVPRYDTRRSSLNDRGEASWKNTGESPAGTDTPVTGPIDLNRADSAELEALPGIGPVLSVRIIKYRYLLGYYYTPDQLADVYGLDGQVIEMNRHRFICDTGLLRKIYINSASYSDLLRHPYIGERQVEAIMSHRQLYGPLKGIPDLIANRIFTAEEMSRLKPYLDFR